MAIFNNYVCLPEGTLKKSWSCGKDKNKQYRIWLFSSESLCL